MIDRPHGYSKYQVERCRCFTCALAKSEYRRRSEAGLTGKYVDAQPAREHFAKLRAAGFGTRRLADMTGVSRPTLQRLPSSVTVHQRVAEAVLAVPVAAPPPSMRYVPAVGTKRRAWALAALGWSLTVQADLAGIGQIQLLRMLKNPTLSPRHADSVRRLYDELSMQVPAPGRSSTRVRGWAKTERLFPPLAWDDDTIDDPAALPCLLPPLEPVERDLELGVQHVVAGHHLEVSHEIRREIVRRLPDMPRVEVAALARCDPKQVNNIRRKLVSAC